MSFAFDTSTLSRDLETAGLYTHDQAEKFSLILAKNLFGLVVSKQDLKAQEDSIVLRTTLEIEKSRAELNEKIEKSRAELNEKIEKSRAELNEKIEKSRADSDAKHAATQLQIEQLRSETTKQTEQLRSEIERSKADLMKWFIGLLLGQAALIATLVKLL